MNVGFYTVFRVDPQHMLHAAALVRDVRAVMPDARQIVHFTDEVTGFVPGVWFAQRKPNGQMLERRLEHYADADYFYEWLFLDTDTSIRSDVGDVFQADFDVALTDRNWPHLPQAQEVMHTMPFNTGVAFSRCAAFWRDVLATWRKFPDDKRDWMSEQRAVYEVVRSGNYRVKILPGQIYNYPPASADDPNTEAAIWHYKGPERKKWLTQRAYKILGQPQESPACV